MRLKKKGVSYVKLENCPECGKLYVYTKIALCPDCIKSMEKDIEKCQSFLRSNPLSTIEDVHQTTGLTIGRITKIILKRRINIDDYPNLEYPCDRCGDPIRKNRVCDPCYKTINGLVSAFKNKDRFIK